jgi:acyl carrier protein
MCFPLALACHDMQIFFYCYQGAISMFRSTVLFAVFVCLSACSNTSPPQRLPTAPDAGKPELIVRKAIGELFKTDATIIDMNRPISESPLNADDLDLVELVMEIEEQLDVTITDAELEKAMGGKLGTTSIRITPAQLVDIASQAKLKQKP